MRYFSLVLCATLASCQTCPTPVVGLGAARILDRAHGIPKLARTDAYDLLDETAARRCQVLFEQAFGQPYAVWLVQTDPQGDATVVVRARTHGGVQTYSAPLDVGTGLRLSRLCVASVTARFTSCASHGHDGVWYHAAYPQASDGYAMTSFWSPRPGSVAHAFVQVAEDLAIYAIAPQALRSQAWERLQKSEEELAARLSDAS